MAIKTETQEKMTAFHAAVLLRSIYKDKSRKSYTANVEALAERVSSLNRADPFTTVADQFLQRANELVSINFLTFNDSKYPKEYSDNLSIECGLNCLQQELLKEVGSDALLPQYARLKAAIDKLQVTDSQKTLYNARKYTLYYLMTENHLVVKPMQKEEIKEETPPLFQRVIRDLNNVPLPAKAATLLASALVIYCFFPGISTWIVNLGRTLTPFLRA